MLINLSVVNNTTAINEFAMIVVKIACAKRQLICLPAWLEVTVVSETCLVGVERLLVKAKIMSERATLATKSRESLLVEF